MKKLFLLLIVMFFSINLIFAASSPAWKMVGDCWLKDIDISKKIKSLKLNYIDEQIVNVAKSNLESFCECVLNNAWCSYTRWPMTPYFFEHLIDVSFRKIDGISNLSYVWVDSDWQKRREFLEKKIVEEIWKVSPQQLQDEFQKYWNFEDYEKWILTKKYNDVCKDIEKIYNSFRNVSYGKLSVWTNIAKEVCNIVKKDRFVKEYNLIKSFMIYKWAELVEAKYRYYLIDQFLKRDFNRLFEIYTQMLGYFRMVVQQVIWTLSGCNR